MNIISNNCVGGYIYVNLNKSFANPFMWCFVSGKDMITLIEEFDSIDFNNFKIQESLIGYYKDEYKQSFTLTIDNKIDIHYIHYRLSDNEGISKIGNNVYSKDIVNYIAERYLARLNRMYDSDEPPIFVVGASPFTQKDEMIKIMSIKSKYKRIVLTDDASLIDYADENSEVIVKDLKSNVRWTRQKAQYIIDNSEILKDII